MCGRFYVGGDFREKLNELMRGEGVALADPGYDEAGQDVYPSNASTVICGHNNRLAEMNMYWGFTNPYRKGLIINARSETARDKNLFSDSIMNRRCVIPASGFYEWDRYKARFRFTRPDDGLIFLAGFWREEEGGPRYTILTTDANSSMLPVHDRMPVMIGRDEIRPWIKDSGRLSEFLDRPQIRLVREQDSGQIRMEF
jgi:putative SOS response-associated peptidase YedK